MTLLLDGPIGTQLNARRIETPAPGWSAYAIETHANVIAEIHRAYANADATVHTANTFRTKRRQFPDRWEKLAREAVAIARRSIPKDHRIAGSIAPLEDCYEPDRAPPSDVARREHEELAKVLADECEILLCETFPLAREAAIATEAAARTGRETWTALTAGPTANLMTPESMREAARMCIDSGAKTIFVNCTPAAPTLLYLQAIADLAPCGVYANGEGLSADAYVRFATEWLDAGASILGSCCFTGPEHIRALSALLSAHE